MLYLVATPIGNLKDFSFRAVEILKSCDYILCEDTRHSKILLDYYDIHKPLKSFHKFKEATLEDAIIADLHIGKTIALISDAGTPGISDPGERLVHRCHHENLKFNAIPGCCAAIQAVICSGLPTQPFQFIGFLPRKSTELHDSLIKALLYAGTTIAYQAPKRLLTTLDIITKISPTSRIAVCRELTKKFEETKLQTAQQQLQDWQNKEVKGEIVIVIEGDLNHYLEWQTLSPQEHVDQLMRNFSLSQRDAIKLAAEIRSLPKKELYNLFIKN
ncbi:MAG: 16S rRNA (cytidine(1402)-2'-O)-methyltransferase [Chlamydiota bacterium]